ncbi:sensor histidine kinase [Gordonia jinhuaensis]|uniref:Two-component sensor histidine kinase n=1 Tax=Gordonia jinhuaensis TaxID=1517702 RepID=A0A916TAD3_9ACTN|nr:sensor histidine kinase [Gordonia jinhuaensis]GGB36896.1 two-component sensor histidine kinase [Gordonia jinhuaensis]
MSEDVHTRPHGWKAWRDTRWAFAAVWLFFLAYPLVAIPQSHHSLGTKIYGIALVVLFAAAYVVSSVYVLTPIMGGRIACGPVWLTLTVFAIIALASIPVLGSEFFVFAPYVCAIAVFTLPLAAGVAIVFLLLLGMVVIPEWVPGWSVDTGLLIAVAITGLTLLMVKVTQVREIAREKAQVQQRELKSQLAVAAERERVARDVHDILGHSLTVLTLKSELAARLVDRDPERAKAEMTEINDISRRALAEVRATVGNLRSPDLRTELASARTALRAADIDAELPDPDSARDSDPTLAWVLREAVTNVVRHSDATRCRVEIEEGSLSVSDNGKGINGSVFGNGLSGLAARVADAGGVLDVAEPEDGGTRVTVRMSDAKGVAGE